MIFSDDFEGELATATDATMLKYWKDGKYPVAWDDYGFGTGANAGNLQIEVTDAEFYEGSKSVHFSTQDSNVRINIAAGVDSIDYTKEYKLRMWVKTKDVTGTGFYARSQIKVGGKNTNLGDGHKLKGTNDWTLYELPYSNVPEVAGSTKSGPISIR